MQIGQDSVVTLHYTLRDEAGEVLDKSDDSEPLAYLHGHGQIVPGLERELAGKAAGARFNVKVAPAEGYGEYDQSLLQRVPRQAFKGIPQLAVGMRLQAQGPQGHSDVVVTEIGPEVVTVDGNHPLAGKALDFDIEVADVRSASREELTHGHVHGPGGHHHD